MRNLFQWSCAFARPQRHSLLRLKPKCDDGLNVRPFGKIIKRIAPGEVIGIGQDGLALLGVGRKQGDHVGVETQIGAREAEFGQKSLSALPGISHQRATGNALGRTGIRGEAKNSGAAIEAAAVKHRPPIEPEMILESRVGWHGSKFVRKRRRRTRIVLDIGHGNPHEQIALTEMSAAHHK